MAKILLIELPYLGNLAFYKLLTNFDTILIEKQEFFEKSSFRNRCEIASPNGKLTLSVHMLGGKGKKQLYTDAQISYEHPWLKDHWNSLTSSYRRSPYFEYYEDKFEAVFKKKHQSLFDLNWELFQLIKSLLKLDVKIETTKEFFKSYEDNEEVVDYRSYFLPKKKQTCDVKYMQVFEDKTGFINNLSIVDLLFNEGPNALNILKNN